MDEQKGTERKIPEMISAFAFESAMMHKDADNERLSNECERMHRLVKVLIKLVSGLVAVILFLIVTFVTTYTIRTRFWLTTFERFIPAPVTEVQNAGVYNQSDQ